MEASRKAGEDASYPIGRERIEIEELQVRRVLRSLDKDQLILSFTKSSIELGS